MERVSNLISTERFLLRTAVFTTVGLSLLCASVVHGDAPVGPTPPVSPGGATATTPEPGQVYNWTQVPQDQAVTIVRAAFDKGGYQLYDKDGDTIIVPFVGNNLYVMKFAKSTDGTMFFVNEGNTPVLYVPAGGYLENATVTGARWYPITPDFEPTTPVYMGIAPSYDDYLDMGWYTDTTCDGGYYNGAGAGPVVVVPCPGVGIVINGTTCHDWKDYRQYCDAHHPPFHCAYFHQEIYKSPIVLGRPFPVSVLHAFTGWPSNANGPRDPDSGAHSFGVKAPGASPAAPNAQSGSRTFGTDAHSLPANNLPPNTFENKVFAPPTVRPDNSAPVSATPTPVDNFGRANGPANGPDDSGRASAPVSRPDNFSPAPAPAPASPAPAPSSPAPAASPAPAPASSTDNSSSGNSSSSSNSDNSGGGFTPGGGSGGFGGGGGGFGGGQSSDGGGQHSFGGGRR